MDEVEFGRYRLLGLIGEGAMGQVFKARDTVIGRDVAIKLLPTELAIEPGYRERFRREAYTAAQLTEPHVIPIFDTGEIDGRLYLVMPIIDGVDVASVLHRNGPMSPKLAVRVIEQLAGALDAAHAHGLVHRDVKPSNALMTGPTGREFVYLIDFGIAHDSTATKLTRTGSVLGTLAYMAPERFTAGKADARADIYALGCVLHECLTGSQPFPGDSMEQQIAGHLTLDPPRPSEQRPGIPTGFDDIIVRSMAKNPDDRYQSAQDLAVAAEQALTVDQTGRAAPAPITLGQPTHQTWVPTQLATPYRTTFDVDTQQATTLPAEPRLRRNRHIPVIVGAAAVIVAIVGVLGYLVLGRTPARQAAVNHSDGGAVRVTSSKLITRGGTSDPKVVLSLYEDFLCPACGNFEQTFGPTVSRLIDSGAVAADYYLVAILDSPQNQDYPSRAASAAYCVADESIDAFRRFHGALFNKGLQPAETASAFPDNARLIELAREAGTAGNVADCINSGKYLATVSGMATAAHVSATPTVRINGEDYDPSTPDALAAKVQEIVGNVPAS